MQFTFTSLEEIVEFVKATNLVPTAKPTKKAPKAKPTPEPQVNVVPETTYLPEDKPAPAPETAPAPEPETPAVTAADALAYVQGSSVIADNTQLLIDTLKDIGCPGQRVSALESEDAAKLITALKSKGA